MELAPLNRLGLALAIYLVGYPIIIWNIEHHFNAVNEALGIGFLLVYPGLFLSYATMLLWHTRTHPAWARLRYLPLQGRWLCALVTGALAVLAVMVLLGGMLVTFLNIWQATYPH